MCQTTITVWFVCQLCRGCFEQVDAFIEHKKEKHFTQFQNTTCIIFEERDYEVLSPIIINNESQQTDENAELPVRIEMTEDDPIIPFSSEIINEQNLAKTEPKSEPTNYKGKEASDSESNLNIKQAQQNPYVLLKRLTSEEIQRACVSKRLSTLRKHEQKNFASNLKPPNSSVVRSNNSDNINVKKSAENQPTTRAISISTAPDRQLKCSLCSKQLPSKAQLKIHVRICALHHKDRNRYCVTCNKKLSHSNNLKRHRLRFHGTEEEKTSLYKFKCQLCPKQYQRAVDLRYHLKSHKAVKQQVKTSKSVVFKCSQPNCGKHFSTKKKLRGHTATHFDLRPFSCSNCNKKFMQASHLREHMRIHTGERPYKCTVDNCNKTFTRPYHRSLHQLSAHRNH